MARVDAKVLAPVTDWRLAEESTFVDCVIRDQVAQDIAAVHEVVTAAFKTMPYACGREQFVMDALWTTGAATVALVAELRGALVGQAAFSRVMVDGLDVGWHGLGPVAVSPELQRQGIGRALIVSGLERLRAAGSKGCVVVGDPDYYKFFGFRRTSEMFAPGVPPEYFMALSFDGEVPPGAVAFDAAFEAKG